MITTIPATEFKAKCLDLMDRVARTREPIRITKRGRVVAELGPPSADAKPWLALRGQMTIKGDLTQPGISEADVGHTLRRKAKVLHGRRTD